MSQVLLPLVSPDLEAHFDSFVAQVRSENADRGRRVLLALEADEKQRELTKSTNPALAVAGCVKGLPVAAGKAGSPSKGMLKLVAYACDRLTVCAYQGGAQMAPKRMRLKTLQAQVSRSVNLDILRKPRRQLKVGGRWREIPLTTKFTSRAQNWIRDGGSLIESALDGRPMFLTLTCPGGTKDVYEAFSIASGYIVDRFTRWFRGRVMEGFYTYVWEVQERGAPHLHFMFKLPWKANYSKFYSQVRKQWRDILLDVSDETGVDLFATADGATHRHNISLPVINFRAIKTSVSGYMAKYASKQRTKGGSHVLFKPGRWWGISYPLRREVLKHRLTVVLGLDTIEKSAVLVRELVEMLKGCAKTVWVPERDYDVPGEFVSIVLDSVKPRDIVRGVADWLMSGDLGVLHAAMSAARAAPA